MYKLPGTSLQINLSPSDYLVCKQLLQYQIAFFYDSVDEVVLTVESKRSSGKRFGTKFEENKESLYLLLNEIVLKYPKVRLVPVDYNLDKKKEVTSLFFYNTLLMPNKDFRGGPFYSYFFGLYSCKYKYILHIDCDMFLGGKAKYWLPGALELLNDPNVLFVLPLSGPKTENFEIKQNYIQKVNRYSFHFQQFTTRIFLTDIEKLTSFKLTLKFLKPTIRKYFRAVLQKNFWELPEVLFSNMMKKELKYRIDYWGENDTEGCFHLHPTYKPEFFIDKIPELLLHIEQDDFPESQRGSYDINEEFFGVIVNNKGLVKSF